MEIEIVSDETAYLPAGLAISAIRNALERGAPSMKTDHGED